MSRINIYLYESEFDGSFHACQVGDRLGAGLPEEGDASHCAGFQRISTKDMKLIAGALHGRGHDRLVLFWVAFRQSGTKAGLLFCRCGSGGLLGQIIAIVFSQALVGLLSGLIHNYWAFVLLRLTFVIFPFK